MGSTEDHFRLPKINGNRKNEVRRENAEEWNEIVANPLSFRKFKFNSFS